MGKFTDRTGEKHLTQEGYQIEIIEYFGVFNCTVIFEDGLILKNLRYASIKIGKVLNLNFYSINGIHILSDKNFHLNRTLKFKMGRFSYIFAALIRRKLGGLTMSDHLKLAR